MSRVKILYGIKTDLYKFLKPYLLDNLGPVFTEDLKIVYKSAEKNTMKVEIVLINGVWAYLLGNLEASFPIEKYINEFK